MRYTISCCFLLLISIQYALSQSATPMRISPAGHYFTDQAGQPFLWLGDTEWELFHQLTASDAGKLLLERKKQGFTVVQVMVTGVFREWAIVNKMAPDTINEVWQNRDPSQINENYFKRVDSIIAYAASINMILVAGVYHAQDIDHGRITLANARPWAKWLASRYRSASNIIWSSYPHADTASMEILNEVIKGLQEGDGGTHLITIHPDPSPRSSSFFEPAPWLSFNTLQTWNSGYINHTMVLSDYYKTPLKPVVNGEARYEEEDGTTPADTRRAAYFSFLAGGFYSYGHRDNWKSARTWKKWYASAGAKQMSIFSTICKKISWWKLAPDSTLLINPQKGNLSARSQDNDWLMIYVTKPVAITVNSQYLSLIRRSKIAWINPETGNIQKASFTISGNGIHFTPPTWTDAILLCHTGNK